MLVLPSVPAHLGQSSARAFLQRLTQRPALKLNPNLVGPAWIMGVGVVALWLPAPGIGAGLLLLFAVLVVPVILTVSLWNRSR